MTTQVLKIFRETALPGTLQPYSIYMIAPTAKPDYVEMYVTNSTGSSARRIINSDDINTMIQDAIAAATELIIVNTIAERNALSLSHTAYVFVIDATGDPTVASGGATYLWNHTSSTWIKVNEAESLDISHTWSAIEGKPTSTPLAIDTAVSNSHTHTNKTQLDKISEDVNGNPTYNSSLIHTGWDSISW